MCTSFESHGNILFPLRFQGYTLFCCLYSFAIKKRAVLVSICCEVRFNRIFDGEQSSNWLKWKRELIGTYLNSRLVRMGPVTHMLSEVSVYSPSFT
jgi:hypothetical protein